MFKRAKRAKRARKVYKRRERRRRDENHAWSIDRHALAVIVPRDSFF
jgi:hypothetical protein